jgi:aspartate racemase
VQPCIDAVKRNDCIAAGQSVEPVITALLKRGARRVVLACTELPLALDAIGSPLRAECIDSTAALARSCVNRWREQVPNL